MIYLDAAATMPLRDGVANNTAKFMEESWGSVSGAHEISRQAKNLLEEEREKLAVTLGVQPDNIIFTSGATESLNLVIQGFISAHPERTFFYSAIEHAAVMSTAEYLKKSGRSVISLGVNNQGIINQRELDRVQPGDLVCVMAVNNEIGVINDVKEIARVAHSKNAYLLVDCVQAFYAVDPKEVCEYADYIVFSGHKIGGPKGVGVLIIKDRKSIRPIIYGGPQEWELRPGTTPSYLAASFVEVFLHALDARDKETQYISGLNSYCRELINTHLAVAQFNSDSIHSSPHIISVYFPGIEAQMLVSMLDKRGVCVSRGSACASGATTPSHVLQATGLNDHNTTSTIRLSFSHMTTHQEIQYAITMIMECVDQLLKVSA